MTRSFASLKDDIVVVLQFRNQLKKLATTAQEISPLRFASVEMTKGAVFGDSSQNNKFINYLYALKPYINHFHIHDNHGKRDEHNKVGKGNIDFKTVFKIFDKNKYNFILETRNFKSAIDSMNVLKRY